MPVSVTCKSLSEALIFASTNPQYDNRLLIELRVQCMKIPSSEHVKRKLCTQIVFVFTFRTIYVHNMFLACSELGIFIYRTCNSMNNLWVSWGKNKSSEKDLPVTLGA